MQTASNLLDISLFGLAEPLPDAYGVETVEQVEDVLDELHHGIA